MGLVGVVIWIFHLSDTIADVDGGTHLDLIVLSYKLARYLLRGEDFDRRRINGNKDRWMEFKKVRRVDSIA